MKTTIAIANKQEAVELMKEALRLKLCYAYGEATVLFNAFINGTPYKQYHNFGKRIKHGAAPEHIRMAALYIDGEMIAWALQWLDVRYSVTDEFWRYTRPDMRNKGYQRLLVNTLKPAYDDARVYT